MIFQSQVASIKENQNDAVQQKEKTISKLEAENKRLHSEIEEYTSVIENLKKGIKQNYNQDKVTFKNQVDDLDERKNISKVKVFLQSKLFFF